MSPTKFRILCCDDDLPFTPERARYLRRKGFEVDEATTGAECMKLLARSNYDVLILDIMIPPGQGFDAKGAKAGYETGVVILRQMRELRYGTLVLVVTAKPGIEVKQEVVCRLGLPEWCYLEKPVPLPVVLERIERALAERRTRDAISKGN